MVRSGTVKASLDWLHSTKRKYGGLAAPSAFAHLGRYTAELYESGSGSPIVLIPGLAGGYELLGPLAKSLAQSQHVYSYQLRGESDCFVLRHPFDLDDLVEDLAELLDQLKLESPTIMGLSFGSVIAMKFAIRYPYRLNRLIVQGTGARFEGGLLQQIASTVLSRFPLPADNPFVNQFFNLLFGGKQKRDSLFDFVTEQIWRTDQSVMAHRLRLLEGLDVEDQLGSIRVPTLVLCGDRDVMVSPKSLSTLCERIPDVRMQRLPKCGHLAFVTKPDAIVKSVKQFVEA
jgi:pimeloyl-ACP methyl ester carboxylesterase